MDDDEANANSELRYIAMELTKLAAKQKKPFRSVAAEYIRNVYELEGMLRAIPPIQKAIKRARTQAYEREQQEK
jgi:hypothetical protein